ncbi:MAG: hypothetical protein COB04_08680 [Gammaproteobacteria bacterium]|nr:MAG: hypothetical protein COB04_08680 [Gammaproteobacteria bacterium]
MKNLTRQCIKACQSLLILIPSVFALTAQAAPKYSAVDWELPSTRFAELGLSANKVADLAQGGQFVIVGNPQDFTFWNAREKKMQEYRNQRVVYAAMVINAPRAEIQEMVWDMGSQDQFTQWLKDTENLSTEGNVRIASYEQVIKVPVIKLASDFVVQLNKQDNGDIGMMLIDEGDVGSLFQYWEFFPIDDNRTLTVLSTWQDTDSASFMYKTVLEAEPVIGSVFPILATYQRLRQFETEASSRHPELAPKPQQKDYDIRSVNGYITDNKALDVAELKKLTSLGSVQFYQQERIFTHEGEMNAVTQVSAVQYIPLPKEKIQPLLNDFSSLVEYNVLTDGWSDSKKTEEDWGFLELAIAIGPFKLPIDIYVTLEDHTDNKLIFHTADHSYMHPLFGHVEYIEMDHDPEDNGTIVELTIGGVMGPDASFLFRMARHLPFSNVLIAAVYTMVTSENMTDWVVARVEKDEMAASQQVATTK